MGILIPLIAAAQKPKEKPLIFAPDDSFPKVILRPYANEFKTKIQGNKKPIAVPKTAARNESPAVYSGKVYSKEEVKELIKQYAQQFGIDPATPLCIAEKESGFNQFSANKRSSAKGVFQYLEKTYNQTDEGKAGYSVFDAEANIKAAMKYMSSRKNAKPWTVHTKCPPFSFL